MKRSHFKAVIDHLEPSDGAGYEIGVHLTSDRQLVGAWGYVPNTDDEVIYLDRDIKGRVYIDVSAVIAITRI